jgi:hypothetical protein
MLTAHQQRRTCHKQANSHAHCPSVTTDMSQTSQFSRSLPISNDGHVTNKTVLMLTAHQQRRTCHKQANSHAHCPSVTTDMSQTSQLTTHMSQTSQLTTYMSQTSQLTTYMSQTSQLTTYMSQTSQLTTITPVHSALVGGTKSAKKSSRRCSAASVRSGLTAAVLDATTTLSAP